MVQKLRFAMVASIRSTMVSINSSALRRSISRICFFMSFRVKPGWCCYGHFSIVDVHFVGFWRYERENFDQIQVLGFVGFMQFYEGREVAHALPQ